MIELSNIEAGYGKRIILHDVSTAFSKGHVTCIIGPNGCGKSTLLKTVMKMLSLSKGQVRIDSVAAENLQMVEVARKIAYLAQGKAVPNMTVEQLVLHGRFPYLSYPRRYRRQDKEIAIQAMKQMHIENIAQERLAVLSGGMRQNAYIAMALAQSTDYILMDEPTTYLDIAHQLQLMDTLKQLSKQGKGIVTVLHDLPLAMRYADELMIMKEGQVIMQGPPSEIYAAGIINTVFGIHLYHTEDGHYYI